MNPSHRSVLLSVLMLCSVACGDDDVTSNDAGMRDSAVADAGPTVAYDFTAFDSKLQAFLSKNNLAGASAVIVHKDHGIVHTQGYGEFAADRLYLIASSSKLLTVGVLMRLADQGKLDMDAPISKYLGDWGSFKTDITTAMLVSNSSGLVSLTDNPYYAPYVCQYMDTGSLSDCAKTIYTANDAADRKKPDTGFHYGGGPWQLAGGVAEVVSGQSWADLVKATYVDPCHTPSVAYTNQFGRAAGTSYPTFFNGDVANLPITNNPSMEGGAYTNAEDYGKLLLMHLRGGLCDDKRVLSEASVARMQVDRVATYNGTTGNTAFAGYGLAWWIDRTHPGVFADPGAYGAIPWLDLPRGYGAMILLESTSTLGGALLGEIKPVLDEAIDNAQGS